jgi:hypothetical protein
MTENLKIATIAGCSAIIGGLVSGSYQHVRDFLTRPRLQIDFKGTEANRVEIEIVINGSQVSEIYLRAGVRNRGRQGVKGCRVYLAGVKEVHPTHLNPTAFYDPMPLSWPNRDFETRDMPRGVDMYVDIVRISRHSPGWNFSVKDLLASALKLLNYSGTYRLYLVATAENASPAMCQVDVTYKQDWNTLRVAESKHRRFT